ncbi:MAG: glycosyltransferase family A protein [Candidatus Stygibacter australis]|nr:glycosyltransferase family A protein [Candidatus Stygibacter australis]
MEQKLINSKITVAIFNFNGFREPIINGKGRIVTTVESLLEHIPQFKEMNVLFVDNESTDGSLEYLRNLSFGKIIQIKRLVKDISWSATTKNNIYNLNQVIKLIDTPYFWRIEDDSYFYNSKFVEKAIDVLDYDKSVDIIHLRRWTKMDAKDMPGVGRNLNRIQSIKRTPNGNKYYLIQKLEDNMIWILVKDDLEKEFIPDEQSGYGKCPMGENEIGSVRINRKGKYERLLTEKWATYTNHGWICRTDCLRFAFSNYKPLSEGDLASIFKMHFYAAKLDQDAFVAFGWRTRNTGWKEDDAKRIFEYVKNNNYSSTKEYNILDNDSY